MRILHLISQKTNWKEEKKYKAHFVYKMSETFILPSYFFFLFFCPFLLGYSWEKVDMSDPKFLPLSLVP